MTWVLTPELEASILSDLENGESLVKICEKARMPSRNTVLRWQRDMPDFGARCACARESHGDLAADQLSDINAKVLDGTLEPQAASVISANLKWTASKLKSRVYGDKQHIELTGKDGAPLSVRLIEAQQRLLKDITPQTTFIEHLTTISLDDII